MSSFAEKPSGGEMPIEEGLALLIRRAREGHLCIRQEELGAAAPKKGVVRDGDRIYLHKNWIYETTIIENIRRLKASPPTPLFDRSTFLEQLEREKNLLPGQKAALRQAFETSLFVLSGGPGTGKTYTAASFIRLLVSSLIPKEKLHLVLAAPTGKAASHLQSILLAQNLHCEATTLHRLLKLRPGENHLFSEKRIDADLVVVDEASMVDVSVLAHLLEATSSGSRLILMGDPDQLPPIDQGSLFADLTTLFGASLTQCMRTEDTALSPAVRRGDLSPLRHHRLEWLLDDSLPKKLFERIQPICTQGKPDPKQCLDHYASLRILNALRQGPFGTTELNRQLVRLMDPTQWCALPILITANDPHSQLYNGMTGILLRHPLHQDEAFFPGRSDPIFYLPPFELAFCLSIHKSQGSEFNEVIALFPPGSEKFGRESLYTAITRAKKQFQWIGEEKVLAEMISRSSRRMSGLIDRFRY